MRSASASRWPLAGAALLALLAGTTRIEVPFAAAPGAPNELTITSSLLTLLAPFADALGPLELAELLRGALMLGFGAAASALLRRARSGRTAGAV